MFDDLMTDKCYVIDENGKRTGPFNTRFTNGDQIRTFDQTLDAKEGDTLIQPLPNGKEVSFTIKDVKYVSGIEEGSWLISYLRGSAKPKEPKISNPIYNFHGANNVQIGDNNIQNIRSAVETLVHGINTAQATPSEKEHAKGLLRTFLENPTTSAVLGAATSGLVALLG
ncbi:hypothetical protein FBY10_101111 [Pseudomonas sp. SJZ103]|uniref:hypothetical protein n=1 Tax=unclassified Pseudomonas TaxID=196821 RepID=UPI0011A9942A|nr:MULTISPECIES: hypothetical protein [unclassified Pseudomonas]TWC74421.1 hypothetical protein FBY10_101111 [Pseudomonas sp. SJZ103]TWC93450.1 hypothetical protein FBY08_101947 [Pseudomonas sp. SJZ094]